MVPLNELDKESILAEKIFIELFEEPDEIQQMRLSLSLIDRAKELGVKTAFEDLRRTYKKVLNKTSKEAKHPSVQGGFDNYTQFGTEYEDYYCSSWIADSCGITIPTQFGERRACYHPILPIQRLVNAETGKEKIKLAFKRGRSWKEIVVDKGIIASSNRIVGLADYGVAVTSETSKALVQFLADVENYNINLISKLISTSKLGWIQGQFMPYNDEIIFDNEEKFKNTYESIHENGSNDIWLNLVRKVRKSDRMEPKIYLAGSLASALVEPINALPFIINLWGDTGKGKTVAIMLAASVWAYPGGNDYVTDPKSTVTALELRLDFLNNFPMLIDDMAQLKDKFGGDFSELVYMLCSGKGKDRANANLGLNKSTSWRNAILTNGEHSLVTETMQGGAINRIIDVEMDEGYIFPNGNEIVETIKLNYGFCGPAFIDIINKIGMDEIKEIQRDFLKQIVDRAKELGVEKEEKQTLPMSILLTADKIATDYIFEDGRYINFEYCVNLLKNKGEVSENERAYEFIMSEISINIGKFKPDKFGEYKGEAWGIIEKEYVYIQTNAFTRICERGNFSRKSFLSWADKRSLIEKDKQGKTAKLKRLNGSSSRCICLKLPADIEEDKDGFLKLNDIQIDIPFMEDVTP